MAQKLKHRASAEAVVGGYAGRARRPSGLLLDLYDRTGRLRVVGRTTRLSAQAAAEVAPLLTPASGDTRGRRRCHLVGLAALAATPTTSQ
ncbi:hypothetical protein [Nonomuraea jabiensis]|uniref:hypothetical protein n=1 Tax=Nonomuraea jabiensis TaxID=882448 RepID=UPI0036A59532